MNLALQDIQPSLLYEYPILVTPLVYKLQCTMNEID